MAISVLKKMKNRHNSENKLCYIVVAKVKCTGIDPDFEGGEQVTVTDYISNSDTGEADSLAECMSQLSVLDS